ncbi:MAG: GTPase HflX [Bacteroidetes bacterium]|nr:GTPase HflX [Bacteroidota bacterium]
MTKEKLHDTRPKPETAILVSVGNKFDKEEQLNIFLDELEFLAKTAGAITKKRFIQRLDHNEQGTYVGKGKLKELADYVKENEIDMVIFDDELSPAQTRNIENEFNPDKDNMKVKVIDRSRLILDIFAHNARTAQAKTQVELAQYQYLLPRLTNLWTHLSRQKGGIGMKGAGEKEIETDRRVINNRIALLKEELRNIDRQNTIKRKDREDKPRLTLVGYTNVGKSTIMNVLSKAEILAENKLFSTLDSTVRKVVLKTVPFLLTDTVGFIRKLPHQLIECFKSTLDEVREADALIHVVDLSSNEYEAQMQTVKETIEELGAHTKPIITVFNKIDAMTEEQRYNLHNTYMAKENMPVVFMSALLKTNTEELRDAVFNLVQQVSKKKTY